MNIPNPVIPNISFRVETVPVTATTRKLRAKWSVEDAIDLYSYHLQRHYICDWFPCFSSDADSNLELAYIRNYTKGLDPHERLTSEMADEISRQIDKEISADRDRK